MPKPLALLRSAWSRCVVRFDGVAAALFPFEAGEPDPAPLDRVVVPNTSGRIAALEFDLQRTQAHAATLRREYDTLAADFHNFRRQVTATCVGHRRELAVQAHDLEALTERIGSIEDRFAARTDLLAKPSTN